MNRARVLFIFGGSGEQCDCNCFDSMTLNDSYLITESPKVAMPIALSKKFH